MQTTTREKLASLSIAVFALALAFAPPAPAAPAPISLDPTFGASGVVRTGVIPNFHEAGGLVVAREGGVLVASQGTSRAGDGALARYRSDGALDLSFGGGAGYVPLPAIGKVNAMKADAAGNALLLSKRTVVTRVAPTGLDASFGNLGSVRLTQLDPRFANLSFWDLAVQSDGGIVVSGLQFGAPRLVAIRLLPNGALDRTFGDEGLVSLGFGQGGVGAAYRVELRADGDIVLGGFVHGAPAIACLLSNGMPDPRFSGDGRLRAPLGLRGYLTALAVGADGRILAAGAGSRPQGREIFLLRLGPTGRLDRHFGSAAAPGARRLLASPEAILPVRGLLFLLTRGRGPNLRAYGPSGQPDGWLGRVPGVPRYRWFGTFGAVWEGKLLLAWTPKHVAGAGTIELERLVVR